MYIFYDSIGNATYVGKTNSSTNDLFKEIELRLRTATLRGVHYRKGVVKLKKKKLRQGNVTRLISVYQMHDAESIHNIEALLIRTFMNNLMNLRVENFKP